VLSPAEVHVLGVLHGQWHDSHQNLDFSTCGNCQSVNGS
jgi:hypothetical protein